MVGGRATDSQLFETVQGRAVGPIRPGSDVNLAQLKREAEAAERRKSLRAEHVAIARESAFETPDLPDELEGGVPFS